MPSSVEQPTLVRYQVLAVACSLAVLTYVQRQGFIAATPYIKEDLRPARRADGLLSRRLAGGVWHFSGARRTDRRPPGLAAAAHAAGAGLVADALGVALTAFLPPGTWLALVVLLALRFIFGGFQAGVFPGLARVVADWMPAQQRGFAQGSIWTFSRARRRRCAGVRRVAHHRGLRQ